jgi:xanthine/uracil permease
MSRNQNTSTAYDFRMRDSLVGAQMLFVAFGALVLVSIIALILVFGMGGMAFDVGEFSLKGIGLAGIVGVVLNLVLPKGVGVKE